MKKTLLSVAVAGVLGLGFTGCVGGSSGPINLTPLAKEEITLNNPQLGLADNGAIILKDGKKIFDSEGDIVTTFDMNGKLYYVIKSLVKDETQFKVKDSNKKLIDEFKANGITWFKDNNRFILATKLEKNNTYSIYDNVYEFDGEKFNLINKNLDLSNKTIRYKNQNLNKAVSISGIYQVDSLYVYHKDLANYVEEQIVTNIATGKKLHMSEIKINYPKNDRTPLVIGIRNDIVYYTYQTGGVLGFGNKDYIIEAYDIKANKTYALYSQELWGEGKRIQFLQAGNEVVLKIFDNPKLGSESNLHNHTETVKTKHTNEPAKIISLNTLKEVKSLSSDFSVIPLYSGSDNLAGTYTKETLITFGGISLYYYLRDETRKILF